MNTANNIIQFRTPNRIEDSKKVYPYFESFFERMKQGSKNTEISYRKSVSDFILFTRGKKIEDVVEDDIKYTLLEVENHSLDIVQQETFGPVLTLHVFETEQEAVKLANDSEFGLAASIWSTDVNRPLRIARELDAGTIWINDWAVIYDEFEEGGFKQSGLGRMNGVGAMDDFIEYKHITISSGVL